MCKLKRLTKKYITLNYHFGGDNYYGRTSKTTIRKNDFNLKIYASK